jgi:tyrosine-protein kinase Etk/Wzc
MPDDEINLLDYWNVIALFLTSVIVTMTVSLLLPPYYRSEAVIIASGSEAGGLGAALSALPLAGALAGAAGIQTPADKVMVILKSRTVAEAVIQRFNLLRVFNEDGWDPGKGAWKDPAKPPLMQDAVRKLTRGITMFSKSKEGAITVTVEWKDPKLASDMANYYIAALTGFLNEKAINITTQVVDKAVPAERKSRPKIKMNMILAGFASIFAGVFIVFFLEYLEKSKEQRA